MGSPPSLLNLPAGCPFTPRCPLAQEICDEQEPGLFVTDAAAHVAACHFHDRLVGVSSADLFGTTSIDTEDLTVADIDPELIGPAATVRGHEGDRAGKPDLAKKESA